MNDALFYVLWHMTQDIKPLLKEPTLNHKVWNGGKKIHAPEGEFTVPRLDQAFPGFTYVLDIIRSYGLVVVIYGALSYNNNVQPFLIGAVLEGRKEKQRSKEAKAFTLNMTENLLHSQKLDPVMEDNPRATAFVSSWHIVGEVSNIL